MNIQALVGITVVILGGLVIGGVQGEFLDIVDNKNQDLQDQLDQFQRSINLSEDPRLAKSQLRSTTYLVTLRSIHCKVLASALAEGEVGDEEEGMKISKVTLSYNEDTGKLEPEEQTNPSILLPASTLEDSSVRNLECRGEDSFVRVTGLETAQDLARGRVVEVLVENPAMEFLNLGEGGLTEVLEEQVANDQEGQYGNVRFTYPESARAPLVIDADNPMDQMQPKGVGIPGTEGPDNGIKNHPFWLERNDDSDEAVAFAADPEIANWARDGEEFERWNDCRYPVKAFYPAMENVPMITDSKVKSGSRPLIDDVTLDSCAGGRDQMLEKPENYDGWEGPHRDYEFVICPGSRGRIQSNAGLPYNSGEANEESLKEVLLSIGKEDSKAEGKAENVAFPFVRLEGSSPTDCVDQYNLGGKGWNSLEQPEAQFESQNMDNPNKGKYLYLSANGHPDLTYEFWNLVLSDDPDLPDFAVDLENGDISVIEHDPGGLNNPPEECNIRVDKKFVANKGKEGHLEDWIGDYKAINIGNGVYFGDCAKNNGEEDDGLWVLRLTGFNKDVVGAQENYLMNNLDSWSVIDGVDSNGQQEFEMQGGLARAYDRGGSEPYWWICRGEMAGKKIDMLPHGGGDLYVCDIPDGETTGDWVEDSRSSQSSSVPPDVKSRARDLECSGYENLRDPAKSFTVSEGGEDKVYSLKCGITNPGGPDNLHSFQKYFKEGSGASCRPRIVRPEGDTPFVAHGHDPDASLSDYIAHRTTQEVDGIEVECKYKYKQGVTRENSPYMAYMPAAGRDIQPDVFTCRKNGDISSYSGPGDLEDDASDYCASVDRDVFNDHDGVPVALYFIDRDMIPTSTSENRYEEFMVRGNELWNTVDGHTDRSQGGWTYRHDDVVLKNYRFQTLHDAEEKYYSEVEVSCSDDPNKDTPVACLSTEHNNDSYEDLGLANIDDGYDQNNWGDYWSAYNAGADNEDVASTGDKFSAEGFFPGGFAGNCPEGEKWSYSEGGWRCA